MAEQRPFPDVVLDYLVYAPLGAAVIAAEELPRLAERGRDRFEMRLKAAELLGRFAVAEARRRLEATPSQTRAGNSHQGEPVSSIPTSLAAPKSPPRPPQRSETPPAKANDQPTPSAPSRAPAGKKRPVVAVEPAAAVHELPIPAYDTLAASQVVERLASLTASELESVRNHEAATRRRRTVLHRISQLNAERDGATP